MTARALASATALILLLPACGCDAENVQWAFVSNPGGGPGDFSGGAVIVIVYNGTLQAQSGDSWVAVRGHDGRGTVEVVLPYDSDLALLDRGSSIELRCPLLTPPRVELTGAALGAAPNAATSLVLQVRDAALLHPSAVGAGTLHVASAGSLLVLASGSGLVVFGERSEPEVVGLSAELTTTPAGDELALRLLDGRVRRLVAPLPPPPAERLRRDPGRGSVRLFGPRGEVTAEIPEANVTLPGTGTLFLTASLPQGLPGDPGPISLLMARHNRYLLRIDD